MRFDLEALNWDEKPRRVELAKAVSEYAKKDVINKTVLDFGCGTGLVSLNFCGIAKDILGVDLSQKMVDIYNQKSQKLGCCAKAISQDVNNVNKKFDVIVSSMVFHHIKDIDNMLKILSSKLVDNGKLFIADLYIEDGTFHDRGNDDVFHFGFKEDSFNSSYFKLLNFCNIYTVKKHKEFQIYIWELEKLV